MMLIGRMLASLLALLLCICTSNGFVVSSKAIASNAALEPSASWQTQVASANRVLPHRTGMASSVGGDQSSGIPETAVVEVSDEVKPQGHYDSIICGGGPAGLLSAIMLSQKYGPDHKIAVFERRPNKPPSPSDETVWSDVARFYLLGIGHRGQSALRKFGVFDDFVKASVAVKGRRDWQPGQTNVEDGRITLSKKDVESRVLARDKLVGVLYHHILQNYDDANIDLFYGYEVNPLSFGTSPGENSVTVSVSKCTVEEPNKVASSQDPEPLCDVDSSSTTLTADLLIGADGSARTIANAMERVDQERISNLNLFQKPFAKKPFKVTRFQDDNPRVFKSVPIGLPADWPHDLNYSARSTNSRITMEALPSDDKGNLCGLLLLRPDDELAQPNVDPSKLRAFFDQEFPQFGALIDDEEMERLATKPSSPLPSFRYAGPRLNMGDRTLILGDAAHTVKPYYGLGLNSAFEDVQMLSDALDDAANDSTEEEAIPKGVQLFSDRRSKDASALVTMSRNMDRPGKLFLVTFLLPIILDGIFHKMAPKIFGPNMFGMFQLKGVSFQQIQRKKRLDRALQLSIIGALLTTLGWGVKSTIRLVAQVTGKSQVFVSATALAASAGLVALRKIAAASKRETQEA